jgi:hypothetical protein
VALAVMSFSNTAQFDSVRVFQTLHLGREEVIMKARHCSCGGSRRDKAREGDVNNLLVSKVQPLTRMIARAVPMT